MKFKSGIDPRLSVLPTLKQAEGRRFEGEGLGREVLPKEIILDWKGGRAGAIGIAGTETGGLLWEVVGPDWVQRSKSLDRVITLRAEGDFFSYQEGSGLAVSYDRGFGNLRVVYVGVSGLIFRAAEDNLVTQKDLVVVANLRGNGLDFGLNLIFLDDGPRIMLSKVSLAGGEVEFLQSRLEEMVVNSSGSIKGEPDFSWEGNCERFDGKVRVEIMGSEVLILLVPPQGDVYRAHRICRELNGVSQFDRLGWERKLSGTGLARLRKEIFFGK